MVSLVVVSFGYHYGAPTHRIDKVFDVRDLSHDVASKPFLDRFDEIVTYGRAHPGETIAIGCDKGQHRSVVLANKVASALRTSVYLRDRGR